MLKGEAEVPGIFGEVSMTTCQTMSSKSAASRVA